MKTLPLVFSILLLSSAQTTFASETTATAPAPMQATEVTTTTTAPIQTAEVTATVTAPEQTAEVTATVPVPMQTAEVTANEKAPMKHCTDKHVDSENDQEAVTFFDKYISGKLQIGTRTGFRVLTDSDSGHKGGRKGSGTFLGTIYAVDETQDFVPKFLFAKYFFNKYIGVELAYDSIQGKTQATSIGYSGIKSDGDITVSGPTISLLAQLPTSTNFTPYASFGLGFYSGDFDAANHWGLGYSDPSVYDALGQPSSLYHGKSREIILDDRVGLTLGLGCSYAVTSNWLLDLSMQYTAVDVDGTFNGYQDGELVLVQEGHFPMDNLAFRLGLAYQF
ncbi:MAG: hypothetical protein COA36_00650 [Desulfotalea sp.]|nr:MAG: hypothetical protein COA36_00650 [Desulfotalea sp.]